ncbi:hypothetical protein [Thalassomonas sp. RHCl1]|uniref:hypothetical protein n=1 Tax=Thalassomonas sp. RHCl1 TaxID=2995320 RepID=UPI00248C0EE2|nr:hypothetical protein [Thalassomonas sp. RHCl1]
MHKKNSEPLYAISPEIEQVIHDGQKLLSYIARCGNTRLDPEVTEVIINAKHQLGKKEWSSADETLFLVNYDKLAEVVYPVTVESLDAILPEKMLSQTPEGEKKKGMSGHSGKRPVTRAEAAVAWYRRYTLVALILLLLTQVYHLFGKDLSTNLHDIFSEREMNQAALSKLETDSQEAGVLADKVERLNQQLDANYKLLMIWNQIWSLGGTFSDSLPRYFQSKYELTKKSLSRDLEANGDKLDTLELERSLHQARILFFENILAADAILQVLQGYILPLMYGLLGAFIFVLRSLMREIKALTYTFSSEIKYRLRLTLGALGGMVIGWFLKPEEANALASLSPMALAFLMGYNVDVLFSLMDKVIGNIKQSIGKPDSGQSATPQPASSPGAKASQANS